MAELGVKRPEIDVCTFWLLSGRARGTRGQITEECSGNADEIALYSLAKGNLQRILNGVEKTGEHLWFSFWLQVGDGLEQGCGRTGRQEGASDTLQ